MITRLQVRNFKSLRDVDVPLGPLNVLVGPNMGGKSNILDLLTFLFECWFPKLGTWGPVNALANRQGIEEVLWKGGQDKLLSISIEFVEPIRADRKFIYEIEVVAGVGGYVNIQKETLILQEDGKEQALIVRHNDGTWLVNANGDRLVAGSAIQRVHVGATDKDFTFAFD